MAICEAPAPPRSILVEGRVITEIPLDLYIPPDALEVFLETFQGPLDLLIYLIRKQNLDILNIPISKITHQYMQYIDLMHKLQLELAADYLVMAAMLAEIKSRLLLPHPPSLTEGEEDPRAELVRRLQEYERIKLAAEALDALPRMGRDTYPVNVPAPARVTTYRPTFEQVDLIDAMRDIFKRMELTATHEIQREPLSVRERMSRILEAVGNLKFVPFVSFFSPSEGRAGAVVTFVAMLELLKEKLIDIVQAELLAPIYIKAVDHAIDISTDSSDY